jgi:hypothetical protein
MESPKNWQRFEEKENGNRVFVWKNTETRKKAMPMVDVAVVKQEDSLGETQYNVWRFDTISKSQGSDSQLIESGYSNRNDAHSAAVNWMDSHPFEG